MNLSSIFVGLVLVGLGLPHINGKVDGNRYISPNKEFSVAITENYWPKEKEFPSQLFVDFLFKGDEATFSTFGLSYIEWLSLQRPMSDAEFPKVASSIATEH